MDACCSPTPINDLDHHFGRQRAEEDAAEYAENGLSERGERLLAYLDTQTSGFHSVLDIGCGAGGLHQEMLLRNLTQKAIGLDGSSAFLQVASKSAEAMGLHERVEYRQMDFALGAHEVSEADVVLMERVVCCYPDLEGLLGPAIQKSRRYLALSYPREAFWVRLWYIWRRAVKRIQRSAFQLYYHEPRRIRHMIANGGMALVDAAVVGRWQIDIYRRRAGTLSQ